MENKPKETKTKYIFCNKCSNETNHSCLGEHYRDYPTLNKDKSVEFLERFGYLFWVCAGCETGTLEEYYGLFPSEAGMEPYERSDFFPERTRLYTKPKRFRNLPGMLDKIYGETIHAYNNNLDVLCSIGIRVLLEGICADKFIKGKTLEEKINNMVTILPENLVTNLHNFRFIGNEAAHEIIAPDKNELKLSIEILEDLLNYLYDLDYKMRQLGSSRKIHN